jgi:hypothetical protein
MRGKAVPVSACALVAALFSCLLGSGAPTPPDAKADSAPGYPLTPVSGADGTYETVDLRGEKVLRGGKNSLYLYFRVPDAARRATAPVYVEVRYLDVGAGRLSLQYNAPEAAYREAELGYGRFLTGQGGARTAVFQLRTPAFRQAQNL